MTDSTGDAPHEVMAELIERGRTRLALRAKVARDDVNEFCELVLKDEETGLPITQAPLHEKWHDHCDAHKRLIIWSHTEAGKTSQICVGRTLWLLGRNPRHRIVIISNTREQSSKIIRSIAKYIETSVELKMVFPDMEPGEQWRSNVLQLKRASVSKDPSVQAYGLHGAIMGSRIDHLILDDVLDYENCQTPRARKDLFNWYSSSVASRLTKDATVIAVGTPWHPEDLYHELEKNPLWISKKFPVIDTAGTPTWPSRWPIDRIEQAKVERGPLEFARTMMCDAYDETDARFKREWIDKALTAGEGWPVIHQLDDDIIEEELLCYDAEIRLGGEVRTFSGVDLAVQRHSAADETAISTIMVMPNGDRRLLCIETGRWSGPTIVEKIIDTHMRYNSIVTVENNAAQDFILQFTREQVAIPIMPFTTGRNKVHPEFGIESLAAEMAGDKWIIPNEDGKLDKEIRELVTEMLYYSPDTHTGDRLMSLWLAREGARAHMRKAGGIGVRTFGGEKKARIWAH